MILSGPSGVGTDTVLATWTELDPRVDRVVAYTTRAPRPGEVDGVDYNFVSVEVFHTKASAGDFLEHKEVYGHYYATPLRDMEALLADGKVAVLKIDVQGALTVMELRPDAISVFLLAPSDEVLETRIRGRGTDDEAVIKRRLANALAEIELAERYDHQLVNDDIGAVVKRLEEIVS